MTLSIYLVSKCEMAGSKIECMICTVIGGGAFTGIGAYALWSSRPRAVGGPFGKGAVGLMGCGESLKYLDTCLTKLM